MWRHLAIGETDMYYTPAIRDPEIGVRFAGHVIHNNWFGLLGKEFTCKALTNSAVHSAGSINQIPCSRRGRGGGWIWPRPLLLSDKVTVIAWQHIMTSEVLNVSNCFRSRIHTCVNHRGNDNPLTGDLFGMIVKSRTIMDCLCSRPHNKQYVRTCRRPSDLIHYVNAMRCSPVRSPHCWCRWTHATQRNR